jgi:hypothetical protein
VGPRIGLDVVMKKIFVLSRIEQQSSSPKHSLLTELHIFVLTEMCRLILCLKHGYRQTDRHVRKCRTVMSLVREVGHRYLLVSEFGWKSAALSYTFASLMAEQVEYN